MLRHLRRFALVWSDFATRAALLRVADANSRRDVLGAIPEFHGPLSIANREQRWGYHQPEQINETFQMAYDLLEHDAATKYAEVEQLKQKLALADADKQAGYRKRIAATLAAAEKHNPEVVFNVATETPEADDLSQPVYREYARKKWAEHDRMVTMQRMEQLHMIPDTLPTVEPTADVKVKFPHNADAEFALWVEPGTVLPGFAVAQPPTVQIRQFDDIEPDTLYTVAMVNPDTPDVAANSFLTTLHWGLANVLLPDAQGILGTKWQMENADKVFYDYVPLTPEKNAGEFQRACLWVWRQPGKIDVGSVNGEHFDIRQFAEAHQLTAVGGHLWRQKYDRLVPLLRQQYGLPEGRVFHRVRKAHPMV